MIKPAKTWLEIRHELALKHSVSKAAIDDAIGHPFKFLRDMAGTPGDLRYIRFKHLCSFRLRKLYNNPFKLNKNTTNYKALVQSLIDEGVELPKDL